MITVALTGGVACGKSTVASRMMAKFPKGAASSFDCDRAVRELYEDESVLKEISSLPDAPPDIVSKDLVLNKQLLRELSFENSDFRVKLEGLLHPLVLDRAVSHVSNLPKAVQIMIHEVPLLYEVEFPISRDLDLVVAASGETQLKRLQNDRGIDRLLGQGIIDAQLPMDEKVKRADIVIWNDGSLDSFHDQIDHLILRCNPYFLND